MVGHHGGEGFDGLDDLGPGGAVLAYDCEAELTIGHVGRCDPALSFVDGNVLARGLVASANGDVVAPDPDEIGKAMAIADRRLD